MFLSYRRHVPRFFVGNIFQALRKGVTHLSIIVYPPTIGFPIDLGYPMADKN